MGTLTLTKRDPVLDPVAGKVVSVQGDATLREGGETSSPVPGMLVYGDDVVETAAGTVMLGIGKDFDTPVTVGADTIYKVPR
jgi:hypothetical protein